MKLLISALPLLLQLAAGSLPPPVQPVCNFQMDGRISSYISARSRYFFNSTEDETDTPITIVAPGPGALRISADVLAVVLREIFRYENTTVLPYDYPCSYPYSCVIRLNAVQPSGDNHYIDSGFLYRNRQCYIYASPSRPDCPLNSTTAQDSNPGPSYIRLLESTCSTGLALPAHLTVTGAATAGGYAHISGTGSQQKKLLLTNLAARDPELREFLATFFLPDPGALLSASSHPCDWVRNELLRQRNRSAENATAQGYWSVPPMNQSAYLQPMRLALMWPNGSKLNDIQVLHWARRTVAQLNSEPVDPADAAPAANASAAPAAPRDALRADAIRLRRAGLRLHLEARGMDCNKADALQFFADSVCPPARLRGGVSGPPVRGPLLGLLAATCSDTVRPIAELSTETRSVVVSPTVESAVYNDPTAYPYFFRTIPSLDAYSEVVTQFLRRHNWPDVALLSSSKLFLRREQFEGHRDGLAVCFEEVVDEESLTLKQVKIGDFGLARTVKDYYRTQTQKMVPVRWMPPEAIQYYVFTVHSDVWSYAVVLYELVTFGKYPFEELSQQQVMAQVNHGVTLLSRFPASASPILYAIVSRCWQFEPKQRPVMSEVVAALRDNPECVTPCLDEAPPMQPPEELDRAGGGDPLRAVGRQPSGGGGGGTRDGWSSLSGSSRQLNALSVNSSFSSSAVVVAASLVHAGPTGVSGGRRSVGGVGGTKPRVFSVSGAARTAAAAEVALLSSGRRGSRPKPDPHSSGSAPPGVGVVGDSDSLTDSLAALTHNMPD